MLFISTAHAETAASAPVPPGGGLMNIIFLVAIFAIAWFLIIRPQQKRMKEHRKMVDALQKGDEIITSSGIMGRIVALNDQAMDVEIAKNVVVRLQRSYTGQVLPKGSLKASLDQPSAKEHGAKADKADA